MWHRVLGGVRRKKVEMEDSIYTSVPRSLKMADNQWSEASWILTSEAFLPNKSPSLFETY